MKEKLIIIYFGDYWDDRWRRRQQLAYHLSQKKEVEKVIYIEMPASIPELIKSIVGIADEGVSERWSRIFKHGLSYPLNKIEIITPISLLPYFGYKFGFDKVFVHFLTYRLLRNIIKKYSGSYKIILWISHPFVANFIGKFNEDIVCYDCTEKFSEFKEWGEKVRKILGENDILISQKADLIFTQTKLHFYERKKINKNTYLIPNAVDYDNFVNPESKDSFLSDIISIKKPILGFIGRYNNKYIDSFLMRKVTESFPECSIVFIGTFVDHEDFKCLNAYHNVFFIDSKPINQIPMYLQFFNVCLLPLRDDENKRMGSPLKLFDYLASGKPIVSTKVSGTEEFGDVVTLAESHEEFINGIRTALKENDLSMQMKRKKKAEENSWEVRAEQVWGHIRSALSEKYR